MTILQFICAVLGLFALLIAIPLMIAGCFFFLLLRTPDIANEPMGTKIMMWGGALFCWVFGGILFIPLVIAADYLIGCAFN